MGQPSIVVVTGASRVGKTTLVRALAERALDRVRCYFFDSIGVPSPQQMTAQFGSSNAWQEAMTERWIARLAANADAARIAVLDGQVRPSFVHAAFERAGVRRGRTILIDCSHEVREARLYHERRQPELASRDMAAWAAYLRGQADALGIPIVDTTGKTVAAAADALEALVLVVRESPKGRC